MSAFNDSNDDTTTPSVKADTLAPVYLDGTPIIWDGNDAHIEGLLYDIGRFYMRTPGGTDTSYAPFDTAAAEVMEAAVCSSVLDAASKAHSSAPTDLLALTAYLVAAEWWWKLELKPSHSVGHAGILCQARGPKCRSKGCHEGHNLALWKGLHWAHFLLFRYKLS